MNTIDIERRALMAYQKAGAGLGDAYVQPGACEVRTVQDMAYAVLSNVSGILAVYRVRRDGKLKGLKRWPAALEAQQ